MRVASKGLAPPPPQAIEVRRKADIRANDAKLKPQREARREAFEWSVNSYSLSVRQFERNGLLAKKKGSESPTLLSDGACMPDCFQDREVSKSRAAMLHETYTRKVPRFTSL